MGGLPARLAPPHGGGVEDTENVSPTQWAPGPRHPVLSISRHRSPPHFQIATTPCPSISRHSRRRKMTFGRTQSTPEVSLSRLRARHPASQRRPDPPPRGGAGRGASRSYVGAQAGQRARSLANQYRCAAAHACRLSSATCGVDIRASGTPDARHSVGEIGSTGCPTKESGTRSSAPAGQRSRPQRIVCAPTDQSASIPSWSACSAITRPAIVPSGRTNATPAFSNRSC